MTEQKWKPIERRGFRPPYGYIAGDDKGYWEPVPLQLEALDRAREYINTCSYAEVARWLTSVTGRSITREGLFQLIARERKRRRSEAARIGAAANAAQIAEAQANHRREEVSEGEEESS